MDFKLKLYHDGKARDITASTGSIEWSDSLDSLGAEFSFACKKGPYVGDLAVLFYGKTEIFRGIILSVGFSDGQTREIKGRDFAWYLDKNEVAIQFKKISAKQAIEKLCDRYDVPIGSIAKMNTSIKKVYKGETAYDIIMNILSQVEEETGNKHRIEMRKGKLYVVKNSSIKVEPYYINEAGKKVISAEVCAISGSRSIEEMKNKIVVAGSGEDSLQIKATVKDSKSIKKYGLLTKVETQDNLNEAKARNIGKNKLKELDRIETSFTATMQGGVNTQSGRLIYFNRPEVGVKGWYLIRSCRHQITNGKHTITCEMEKP